MIDPSFFYFATSGSASRRRQGQGRRRLELKADLFGNKPNKGSHQGVEEVFYDPADVVVPPFLPDTPETREELAQYYQSVFQDRSGCRSGLVEILKEADVYDKTLIVFHQ